VGLDRLVVQNVVDRARRQLDQAGITRHRALAACMGRQQTQRPQLVGVAAFLGLGAGLANQPSPRGFRDIRRASRTPQVVDRLERSYRGNPSGTARDPLAVDAERCGSLTGAAPIGQVQDDCRSLDMLSRGSARPGEHRQRRAGLVGQGQCHHLGFARHAKSSKLQQTMERVDSKPRHCQHGRKCGSLSIRSKASVSETR
jgi:hypothetical protein